MTAYRTTIPLRWSDLDLQGHVNNVSVLDFTQEARARFMEEGPAPELLIDGSVLVDQQVEFLHPMRLTGEGVEVALGTTGVGGAKFTMAYHLSQDGRLCARVATTMCPFDFAAQCIRLLTPGERDSLRTMTMPAEQWREMPHVDLAGRGVPVSLQARWSDQDRYGHVNNVRILDWVQEARIEATTAIDPAMARRGQAGPLAGDRHGTWLVARQDIDYLLQLGWRIEPYRALVAPLRVGTSSVTLACEIVDPRDDTVHVRSRTVLVHGDDAGRARPLPESTRAAMTRRLVA